MTIIKSILINMQSKKSKFLKKISVKNLAPPSISILHKHSSDSNMPVNKPPSINSDQLKEFIVLGSCKKQIFIIAHPSLQLIGFVDQHAIHERIRYQYYSLCLKQSPKAKQFAEENIEKEPHKNISVLEKLQTNLLYICELEGWMKMKNIQIWGFKLIFTTTGVYLQSYHRIFGKKLENQLLKTICKQILENQKNKMCQKVPNSLDFIIGQTACKSAIKFNEQITLKWCYDILHNISLCDFPWFCVHGRPTIEFRDLTYCRNKIKNFELL